MGQQHVPAHRVSRFLACALASLLAVGCSALDGGPSASPGASIPVPAGAQVEIGGSGAGFDAGAGLYAYTSDLAPQAALEGYVAQLLAQGFVAAGTSGGWQLFRGHGLILAVTAGPDGPPTDLLVRVAAADSTIIPLASSDGPSPTSAMSQEPTAQGSPGAPSGSSASPVSHAPASSGPPSGSPGGGAGSSPSPSPSPTRSPAATASPSPNPTATCPPPGQAKKSPSPNPSCLPYGQGGPPPSHGPKDTPPGQQASPSHGNG